MTTEEIKTIKETLYATIKKANEDLVELRAHCQHDHQTECNYEWAPAHIVRGMICDDCGEFLKSTDYKGFGGLAVDV